MLKRIFDQNMQYKFTVTTSAEKEIDENYVWYESKKVGLGEEFFSELDDYFDFIKGNPNLFPKKHKSKYHQATLKRFPFVVIYEVIEKEILILSIFKTPQNPEKKTIGIY